MKTIALSLLCVASAFGLICPRAGVSQVSNLRHPVRPEMLVWSDEFNGGSKKGPANSQPDPANWSYDTGAGGFGNNEHETYCAWGASASPCDATRPSAYVGGDGYLHIVARALGNGVYTSARLKTQGLHSFQYGRIEARIRIPEGQGIWPAFWMLGDDIATVGWPASGELDIMENVGKTPSTVYGSIHAPGTNLTRIFSLPNGQKLASAFHTYGLIWSPDHAEFYIDGPAHIYATYTPAELPNNAMWPFDSRKFFILLNLAVGGKWPGNPDASTTRFPQEMLVDYVRVYGQPTGGAR